MPQPLPKVKHFGICSAVPEAVSTWGMCNKHCNSVTHITNTGKAHAEALQNLIVTGPAEPTCGVARVDDNESPDVLAL